MNAAKILQMILCIVLLSTAAQATDKPIVTGELKVWQKVTITFAMDETAEDAEVNPFTDCRLDVLFSQGDEHYTVPGYYAADGDAGQSGASAGNKWRVNFTPDRAGVWEWSAIFSQGKDVAINDFHGGKAFATGKFEIEPADENAPGFHGKGALRYVGKRYLQLAQTGEYFLKAGADSPENFLAYHEFDGTFDSAALNREGEARGEEFIHKYEPHIKDFRQGDPTWKDGKGKGIIGALNYLASKGVNSQYFITYNIDGGDGKDVWPWTGPDERERFDCSKLDQWEIVFSHTDRLGIMMHVLTQETENDQGLDEGELGRRRKLYYRELIARFVHHPALVWNLGEENTNTDSQRKEFARYIRELDPYDHPIVVHTFPGQYDMVYTPLLGFHCFEGPSLQTTAPHTQTIKWLDLSGEKGRQWFVCMDELAKANVGVKPDADDYWHDEPRKEYLWANLMAGGAGCEWYFGYEYAHNDLNCEDFRSREHMWELTKIAADFFHQQLPFSEMHHADELTTAENDYCFARDGAVYAIYLPEGGSTEIDLTDCSGEFTVKWFNPRTGGALQDGTVKSVAGGARVNIGHPPADVDKDWVCVLRRAKD